MNDKPITSEQAKKGLDLFAEMVRALTAERDQWRSRAEELERVNATLNTNLDVAHRIVARHDHAIRQIQHAALQAVSRIEEDPGPELASTFKRQKSLPADAPPLPAFLAKEPEVDIYKRAAEMVK